MKKNDKPMTAGRKWRAAIIWILCMIVTGTVIGFGIVLVQDSGNQKGKIDSYTVADNGYSGNSRQELLQPMQSEEYVAAVNEKVQNSIITIVTEYVSDVFWEYAGTSTGIGTGVIYQMNEDTVYIVTNAHVISGAQKVYVYCNAKTQVPATLKGMDEQSDIAVIAVNVKDIPKEIYASMKAIEWGDSDAVRVGDPSIAIGCPYGIEFGNSVTAGVIGGTEREITYDGITLTVMQTDAAINPGNSGGALVNQEGKLIGINTAKIQMDSVEGMGFAIPSNIVKETVEKLMNDGSIEHPELGIAYYEFITEAIAEIYHIPTGVIVYELDRGSEGWAAGLKVGDIITEIDGIKLTKLEDLSAILDAHTVGDVVELTVIRNRNQQESLKLTLKLAGAEIEQKPDFWGNIE